MKEIKFRPLEADEIECRVARINDSGSGLQLLLYKDARCDMNALDEIVGPANWQRSHTLVNGNLFCSVGINVADDGEDPCWVWKQDVGTESNTEKEKGQASDAFKRACFNWGVGRELYTAPFIWIYSDDCRIEKNKKGNLYCKDTFSVQKIEYQGKRISDLVIVNDYSGKTVFPSEKKNSGKTNPEPERIHVSAEQVGNLERKLADAKIGLDSFLKANDLSGLQQMTVLQYENTMKSLDAKIAKREIKKIAEELPFA